VGGGKEEVESDDHCDDDSVCYVLTWLYRKELLLTAVLFPQKCDGLW